MQKKRAQNSPSTTKLNLDEGSVMLKGKRIVITGGAGVLGQAVAQVASRHGAEVVLLDVIDGFESDLGPTFCVDLTNAADLAAVFSEIGAFTGVANIAGGFDMGPQVHETSDDMWDFMFEINVKTLRRVLAQAVPSLVSRGAGTIVNVGAFGALSGAANMGAYTSAKSTVMRLTEAQSEEVRHQGVNVNAILPSLIDTPRNRADMPDADHSQWVSPEALAEVICFLSSDRAKAVHGALIPVVGLV
ncbi:MAG: NAD(P)-dependent dehydrogenase (short-subunit alcohol dehydrogenase family) [Candidatus Azotimanducaceae bacterium]